MRCPDTRNIGNLLPTLDLKGGGEEIVIRTRGALGLGMRGHEVGAIVGVYGECNEC